MIKKTLKYVDKKVFPPSLYAIKEINPSDLPITAYARMTCQNCGIYGRAILCPPFLYKTYPQFKTINSSMEYFSSFDKAFIYIFKNDGTKRFWFKKDQKDYSHIRLRKVKSGRELKGIEAVGSRYLTRLMRKIRTVNERNGFIVDCFIPGHCDFCARKCPNREKPPCRRGGMASLEATGINVYSLLKNLKVEFQYPVLTELTSVTMMVARL